MLTVSILPKIAEILTVSIYFLYTIQYKEGNRLDKTNRGKSE